MVIRKHPTVVTRFLANALNAHRVEKQIKNSFDFPTFTCLEFLRSPLLFKSPSSWEFNTDIRAASLIVIWPARITIGWSLFNLSKSPWQVGNGGPTAIMTVKSHRWRNSSFRLRQSGRQGRSADTRSRTSTLISQRVMVQSSRRRKAIPLSSGWPLLIASLLIVQDQSRTHRSKLSARKSVLRDFLRSVPSEQRFFGPRLEVCDWRSGYSATRDGILGVGTVIRLCVSPRSRSLPIWSARRELRSSARFFRHDGPKRQRRSRASSHHPVSSLGTVQPGLTSRLLRTSPRDEWRTHFLRCTLHIADCICCVAAAARTMPALFCSRGRHHMHSVALETQEYATHAPHEHRGPGAVVEWFPVSGVNSDT